MQPPALRYAATVLDSPDPQTLGRFYARLLGWEIVTDDPEWVQIRQNGQRPALSFQREEHYVPPVWPGQAGKPLMMLHLDLEVDDLAAAVAWARECGATEADFQPQDDVRVMLDPFGHPFCLFREGA